MVGPPNSGKTTLLYKLIFQKKDWTADTTTGFQFEEVRSGDGANAQVVGVWDIGGNQATQMVLQQIYQLVRFNSIVYVIDPEKPVQEGAGAPAISQIDFSKVHLNRLLAEIELEQVSNVHIVFNLNTQNGRFRNVFANEENSNKERLALLRFLCN